jgi:hypothetical protein
MQPYPQAKLGHVVRHRFAPRGAESGRGRRVSDPSAIETATRRLAAALVGLDAALDRRRDADRREAALSAQVVALGIDRSRLAAELDLHAARAHRLDSASREVSRRLDSAIEGVRAVMERDQR